jgi:hypothetical protein
MSYITKQELEQTLEKFFEGIESKDFLNMQDVRYLCEKGIPAIKIAVRNIPMDCFKKGVEEWLNGL